jgi:hypothetical protein
MYRITKHSLDQAKKFGVELVQSSNPKKKIDVFKDGKKLASIGATGFGDYGTFLLSKGKAFADERRRLYKLRHKGENNWSMKILW